jgi:hypothetical protein
VGRAAALIAAGAIAALVAGEAGRLLDAVIADLQQPK